MFGSLGMPELVVILMIGLFYGVPLVAAIWAIVTLYRIRVDQEAIGARLQTIERLFQGGNRGGREETPSPPAHQ
jgi:hypothetical protein